MRRVPVLFLAGDGWPQWLQGGLANWQQTWHMATTVVAFYNNLNCWSSRCSSARRAPSWPGCCQTRWPACSWPSWPSALQGKDDLKTEILEYTRVVRCTGLLYSWPTLFSPFPIHWRIAYTGHYGFSVGHLSLLYSQQSGDGTLKSAFTFLHLKDTNTMGRPPEK